MIAEVIIDSSVKTLNKKFDYEIPEGMNVQVGTRVFVPFANKKELSDGIVVGIKENSEFKVKKIAGLQPEQIDKNYIELAKWMANRYFCNISECLRLMLPPGKTAKNVEKRVKEKIVNVVGLAKDIDEIYNDIDNKIKSEKQKNVLEFIIDNGVATVQDIELFTDASRAVVNTLIKNGYLEVNEKQVDRNPFLHKQTVKTVDLKLNEEQGIAYNSMEYSGKYLLYGVTGSGKTEIYLQMIEKMLNQGKSSIMLVPEISLTPQTVDRFISRFGEEQIAILHSKLSVGERFDQWNKIKEGKELQK
mgnify:FL=1